MGIGIRNNGGGSKVTIDGEKPKNKMNLKKIEYTPIYNQVEFGYHVYKSGTEKTFTQIDKNSYIYALEGYSSSSGTVHNVMELEYDENCGILREVRTIQDSIGAYLSINRTCSGFIKRRYFEINNPKINEISFSESTPKRTELINSESERYNSISIDKKEPEKIYIISNDKIICYDRETNLSTVLLSKGFEIHGKSYTSDKKIYYLRNNKLYVIDLINESVTELFDISEKFGIVDGTYYLNNMDGDNLFFTNIIENENGDIYGKYTWNKKYDTITKLEKSVDEKTHKFIISSHYNKFSYFLIDKHYGSTSGASYYNFISTIPAYTEEEQ